LFSEINVPSALPVDGGSSGGKYVAQGGIPKDSLIPRLTLETIYRQTALRMDATSPFHAIKHSDVFDVGDLSFFDAQMPN
jgi:hypothetical protein